MYEKLLVPVDGSESSARALAHAVSLARSLPVPPELVVLHVNPSFAMNEPPIGVNLEEAVEEEGRRILEPAVAALKDAGIPYRSLARNGDPAEIILRLAREEECGLIVMGSRGNGLVKELLLGSVSHAVIQQARCPVMIVK
ncbi:universal stress protein [Paenibacillus aurantius]|uniref:Universal stress protein n=1 Tax=Paenibacillus aurantius TaxID=2918900 RepID=A0AA96LC68_9BACL|nr:universal stress protein [Paenibacillus aurantius]WNQ10956.1 universal stress protein [Paenibacillus aurantius]